MRLVPVPLDGSLVCACPSPLAGRGARGRHRRGARRRRRPASGSGGVLSSAPRSAACTPGLVVAATDLLRQIPEPNDDEIREALSGNLCSCTGYTRRFSCAFAAVSG
jgi:carbon-monoxide dehydrogenase small subunit